MLMYEPSEFIRELDTFIKNTSELVETTDSDLGGLFNEAAEKYSQIYTNWQNIIPNVSRADLPLGLKLFQGEMAFFNKHCLDYKKLINKQKKLLKAAIVILTSLDKFFSNWPSEILKELLALANLFVQDN